MCLDIGLEGDPVDRGLCGARGKAKEPEFTRGEPEPGACLGDRSGRSADVHELTHPCLAHPRGWPRRVRPGPRNATLDRPFAPLAGRDLGVGSRPHPDVALDEKGVMDSGVGETWL